MRGRYRRSFKRRGFHGRSRRRLAKRIKRINRVTRGGFRL